MLLVTVGSVRDHEGLNAQLHTVHEYRHIDVSNLDIRLTTELTGGPFRVTEKRVAKPRLAKLALRMGHLYANDMRRASSEPAGSGTPLAIKLDDYSYAARATAAYLADVIMKQRR